MIIAIANEKGGVGKTTTALNLGVGLSIKGFRVLLIDADPQTYLSGGLGFNRPDGRKSFSDLIHFTVSQIETDYADYVRHNDKLNVDIIPCTPILTGSLTTLGLDPDSQNVIARIFSQPFFEQYDFIIFDCPPSLNLLVSNILKAADRLLVPVPAEPWAYKGLTGILNKYAAINNKPLYQISGLDILITMRQNTKIGNFVDAELRKAYGNRVFDTVIPRRIEAVESTASENNRALVNRNRSPVGIAYLLLIDELLQRIKSERTTSGHACPEIEKEES